MHKLKKLLKDGRLSSQQKKAILIAVQMSGNMTGAVKKIEKIKKDLSKDKKVAAALRLMNEAVNEESPDRDLFRSLNHINNDIFRIMNKYQGKADLDAGFRSWMLGLHAKLKKAGIKL